MDFTFAFKSYRKAYNVETQAIEPFRGEIYEG